MAVFQFSALSDGQAISFTPTADVLNFDQTSIAAADIVVTTVGSNTQVTYVALGKDVTLLNVSPLQLSITNVTFADGSRLLFGDTASGTVNDNAANTINGTAGRDQLAGFGGADTMNGGLGNDTYIVSTGDVLSDTGGIDTVQSDVNWNLADAFENLTAIGTANVQLTGNNGANILIGNAGNNFINPRGGDDEINGGDGNDWVRLGGGGVPTYGNKGINGGAGFDTFDFGGLARSAITVNLDRDVGLLSGGGEGGAGSAALFSIESVIGDGFNDRITGSTFVSESLGGGGGNDTLDGRGGNDTLAGGLGADTFAFSTAPFSGNTDLVTDFASATDKLSFDNAVFTALGAAGNFAAGDARFAAGAGFTSGRDASDRIVYNTTTRQLFYDADGNGAGTAQLVATLQGAPALTATDIVVTGQAQPNPTQGTPGNDSLTGTAGNDSLAGLAGNDTLRGLGGDDTLDGGPGSDTVDGGLGNDTYIVRHGEADAFGGATADTFVDAGGVDTVIAIDLPWRLDPGIENLVLRGSSQGGAGGIGNDLNNLIINEGQRGLGEDPFLDGAGGDDTLIGSNLNETFAFSSGPAGNFGHDSVDGGGGVDTLGFGGSAPVTVDFRTGTMTSTAGSVTFTNIERADGSSSNDSLTGNDSGVRLFGFAGNDTLIGGAGNDLLVGDGDIDFAAPTSAGGTDVISGGGGNDDIWLGVGNDQADGGVGNDRFVFQGQFDYGHDTISGGEGIDEIFFDAFGPLAVDLGAGTLRGGSAVAGAGTVSFTGIENFDVVGGPSEIIGSASANALRGADGADDLLNGRGGNDTLTGGFSVDTFVFDQTAGTANADVIIDFQPGTDSLSLSATAMPALGASGRFAAGDARFHAAAGATGGHDADDRLIYDTSTGRLFYDADGSAAGATQLVATLQGRPALAATDILVFGGTATPGVLITGTAGNDTLDGTDRNDTIDGLGGDDLLSGRFGTDLVRGGDGNDRLKDREDSDAAAPDTLDGGLGDDIFDLLASPLRPHTTVIVDAGGVDTVWSNHDIVLPSGIENLTLFEGPSGTGNELGNLIVGFGNIRDYAMDGAGGNDTLVGAPDSTDNMTGGAGNDTFRLLAPSSNPAANLQDNLMDFFSGTDTLQLDNTGFAGLGAAGRLSATDERFFFGQLAHDTSDRLIYDGLVLFYDADGTGPSQQQTIAVLQGPRTLLASDIVVIGSGAPGGGGSVINGTAGNDSLTGTAGNDSISGLAGNDTINALGGDDTLDGGAGIDTMNGGLGNDGYIVTAGDVLVDAGGIDSVLSDIDWTLADGFEFLTLIGTANVSATGNNGANSLIGNRGNNFFNPRGGDDSVQDGAGNDWVRLGGGGVPTYGNKVIDLGEGFDTLDFGGFARSAIVVDLADPARGTLFGGGDAGQGSARLTGIDRVIGDGFNDRLSGSAAAEALNGGGGNDTINGRGGNDTLTGGLGADAFVFATAPGTGNVDLVTDFVSASDRLNFDNAVFTALGADGNFVAGDARFAAGAGFTSGRDASDRLVYNTTLGQLFYDADGSGAGAAQLVATFQGNPAITATDITVI